MLMLKDGACLGCVWWVWAIGTTPSGLALALRRLSPSSYAVHRGLCNGRVLGVTSSSRAFSLVRAVPSASAFSSRRRRAVSP